MSRPTVPPAASRIPMVTDTEGRAYIPASAVTVLLRAMAAVCHELDGQPTRTLSDVGDVLQAEADAIDCRAIVQTRH